ncbi:Protein of unknown function [Arboricoccus pini]|uniref:Uncharacterized protein n=1 Tax=Arboricoccus pini TaxID=1963835 RepID=A0A212PZW0_9PROT|nr:DUF3800 domain-containing protein [Arboricoccus pini]SNB52602.1 Protein of unknown function [Arboricoccus pini]
MERVLSTLRHDEQRDRTVHIIFESRGKAEDNELEQEFRRITDNQNDWGYKKMNFKSVTFKPLFIQKAANSTGLQLTDLVARPIGAHYLRPSQPNRAYEIVSQKLGECKTFP